VPGMIRSIEKFDALIGNRTCGLHVSRIMPQPTALSCSASVEYIILDVCEVKVEWCLCIKNS
jgi:hypothetical protein